MMAWGESARLGNSSPPAIWNLSALADRFQIAGGRVPGWGTHHLQRSGTCLLRRRECPGP